MQQIFLKEIKIKAIPILKKAGVKRASLFGSYAKGDQTDKSDIDILIDVPSGMSLFDFIGLEHKLEDILGKRVDLVDYAGLKPRVKPYIINNQISIL